jgi:hypothetical protein
LHSRHTAKARQKINELQCLAMMAWGSRIAELNRLPASGGFFCDNARPMPGCHLTLRLAFALAANDQPDCRLERGADYEELVREVRRNAVTD